MAAFATVFLASASPRGMAKRLNTVNFVYTAIGLAVAGGIGYYVYTRLRNRRLGRDFEAQSSFGEGIGAGEGTQDNLMELRRSTRKAGRAVKDAASGVGKSVKRGASDVGEAFEDATSSGKALVQESASGNTGYGKTY